MCVPGHNHRTNDGGDDRHDHLVEPHSRKMDGRPKNKRCAMVSAVLYVLLLWICIGECERVCLCMFGS